MLLYAGRHRVRRTLSRDDVGNQARFLMSHFIHDRISTEGVDETPEADALVEPGTPSGSELIPFALLK